MESGKLIDESLLSELSKNQTKKNLLAITVDWGSLFFLIFFCHNFFSWPLYVITFFLIGTRMQALGLMAHEGVHYKLADNKGVNDWLADILICWPLFINVKGYRNEHFPHHNFTHDKNKDPDLIRKVDQEEWHFPKRRASLVVLFLLDCLGRYFFQFPKRVLFSFRYRARKEKKGFKPREVAQVFVTILFFLVLYKGELWKEYLLYWILPFFTVFKGLRRLRTMAEHFSIPGDVRSRTVFTHGIEKYLFAPHNTSYHGEHHLFPNVPYHNLKKLHEVLFQKPGITSHISYTKGYTGVLKEASQFKGFY
tara:strand:- start:98 stop:1021 length:924 start_codon:yes stop_codon:yes gene_type:complete